MLFEHFLKIQNTRHHAILFVSKQFEQHAFPNFEFCQVVKKICHIDIDHERKVDEAFCAENFYHPDILIIERSRAVLRVEDVEKIKRFCIYPPQIGSRRLIFIENCERLNLNSANFILKSLEEPPAQVCFLLTAANTEFILPTILSRVQMLHVTFSSLPKKSFEQLFDADDVQFFDKIVLSANSKNIFFGKSMSDEKKFHLNAGQLSALILQCEQISRKYTAHQLQSLIVHCVGERLKKENAFIVLARCILSHIRAWKQSEPFNPSSQFWLLKIFLGHGYENI